MASLPTIYLKSNKTHEEIARMIFGRLCNGVYEEYEKLDCEYNYYAGDCFGIPVDLYKIEDWDYITKKYQYELFLWSYSGPDGKEVNPKGLDLIIENLMSLGLTFGITYDEQGDDLRMTVYESGKESGEAIIKCGG